MNDWDDNKDQLEKPEAIPKLSKSQNRIRWTLIIVAALGICWALYNLVWLPQQNQNQNSSSTSQPQTSIVSMKDMTNQELNREIERLSALARDAVAKNSEQWNNVAAVASGIAIMYQNELIIRGMKLER